MNVAKFTAIVVCTSQFVVSSGEYDDCFIDTPDRIMTFHSTALDMTVGTCEEACEPGLFGLQYASECWCGNGDYKKYVRSEGCNMECGGDPTEICGGPYAMSVYRTNAIATPGGACGIVEEVSTSCPDDQGCSQYFFCGNTDAHIGDGCHQEYGTCASSAIPAASDTPPGMEPCSPGQFMSCLTHVVLPGQYSSMIAEKHDMGVDDLISMNALGQDGNLIFPQQLLQVKPCRCVEHRSTRRLDEGASRSLRGTSRKLSSEAADTALCTLNVVSAVAGMGAGIATAQPLAVVSAAIAFANSVKGCENDNGDWVGQYVRTQLSLYNLGLLGTYQDFLRASTKTAIESLRDGGDYFNSKSMYIEGRGGVTGASLRDDLIDLDSPIKTAMNALWDSPTLDSIQKQLAETEIAMAAMIRLALRQEIVKVTQCLTEAITYSEVAGDLLAYKWAHPGRQPWSDTITEHFGFRTEELFKPIEDALFWTSTIVEHDGGTRSYLLTLDFPWVCYPDES